MTRGGFLQPGEDPNWHLLPATELAVVLCRTECPRGAFTACARAALDQLGRVPDEPHVPTVADGVVAAGIVCRGDEATADALRAVLGEQDSSAAPAACIGCARPLGDHGETVRSAARGLCKGCYSATARAGQLAPVYQLRPECCDGCARPLVGRRDDLPEGHARYHSGGRCEACHKRHTRAARKAAA